MQIEKKQFDSLEIDEQKHLKEIYPNEDAVLLNIISKKGSDDKLAIYRIDVKLLLINYGQNREVTEIYDYLTDIRQIVTLSFRLPHYLEDFIGVGFQYEYDNGKLKPLYKFFDKPISLKKYQEHRLGSTSDTRRKM